MIDYHSHIAVLEDLKQTIGTGLTGDPGLAASIADLTAATTADPDAAVLGALIDHIIAHASNDGIELQLVESAADLWTRGRALYDKFGAARQGIEDVLENPTAPGSAKKFQAAVDSLDSLRNALRQFVSESQLLQASIAPLPHLKEHPRQADTPSKLWDFGNLFAARRTDAFVRSAFESAASVSQQAFAFGVLSSYAGNVAGSAFLGQVVGGPRRSHRYRDRLARNAVGAWFHAKLATPPTSAVAKQIDYHDFAGRLALPGDLRKLAEAALKAAYPRHTAPDLNIGLRRLVRHLRALDRFQRPPLPDPPPVPLAQGGGETGPLTIMSDDLHPPTIGIPLDPDMQPSSPSKADSSKSGGNICVAILVVAVTLGIALLIYCIGKWSTGKKCKASDFFDEFQGSQAPDPRAPTGTSQSQLTAMSTPDAAAHIAQELYNFHMLLWQAFDLAFAYLASTGLIYPDDLIMSSPLYSQFVTTPNRNAWPHRPEPQSAETYYRNPLSPIEQTTTAAPFTAASAPTAILATWTVSEPHGAMPIAQRLLLQIMRRVTDSENYDLDADRGFLHACWQTAAGTSINDMTVSVQVLPYTAD